MFMLVFSQAEEHIANMMEVYYHGAVYVILLVVTKGCNYGW